MVQKF